MAGSESAAIEQLDEKEIYHRQARAGNRIKQVMAALHMEMKGLDQRRVQLERQYAQLEEALELQQFSPLNIGKRDLPERPNNHLGLCCETEGIAMPGVSNMTHIDIEAFDKFSGKGLHIDQWPESSIEQPVEVKEPDFLPVFQLGPQDKFYPHTMRGADWNDALNFGCSFPEDTEGYWRHSPQKPAADVYEKLPWPVARDIPGYNPLDFHKRMRDVENHSATERKVYRGMTMHRWHGGTLGNAEFWRGSFRWPDSYGNYISEGVPPSRHFFRFIMTEHAEIFPKHPTLTNEEFNTVFNWLPNLKRTPE